MLASLCLAGSAQAGDWILPDTSLQPVARIFAMNQDTTISCGDTEKDWSSNPWTGGTWGVTWILSDAIWLDPQICQADDAIVNGTWSQIPDWQLAEGVLVLVHESYHARHWAGRRNEAAVECKAIRHFRVGAELLGLPEWKATALRPWALAEHYRLEERFRQYDRKTCKPYWPY